MASKVLSALEMARPGMTRLRGGQGGMNYQAATIQEEKPRSSLLESIGRFAAAGADMYMAREKRKKDLADERSNEIIRKLTPQQRREALNNGTLLYQDDPYAMEALRVKSGRNAAYLVDDDVMQKVKNGEFRTREEMEEYRHSRLQEGAKSYAEMFGINAEDEAYQRGFNSDITERNISLYGAHDTFLSEQAKKGALVNSDVELNNVLSDPATLARPEGAEFFTSYINNSLLTGSLPNDDLALQTITKQLSNVSNRVGGANFLLQLADKKVTLHGKETTYRELLGDAQWESMMQTAQSSQFEHDAKLAEKFELNVGSALNNPDPSVGWSMLQGLKAELDKIQPGEQMTPQRERLIAAQRQIQNSLYDNAAKQQKARDEQQKSINKFAVMEEQFQKRFEGEYVSTKYSDMPTNENTGEFTKQDAVNFANQTLSRIDSMDLPQETKDALKLKYLQEDDPEGPFRTAMKTLVDKASGEWQSAVINGELSEDTPALTKLREVRNANPALFAALYPEQASLFLKMDMMDKQGVRTQVLINAEQARAGRTKDQQRLADEAWADKIKTKGVLAMMPNKTAQMAREIYDSMLGSTGNEKEALEATEKFVRESTAVFESGDVDGDVYGMVPRNMLQMTSDPASWELGRDLIQKEVDSYKERHPYAGNLTVRVDGNLIRLINPNGDSVVVSPERLRQEYIQEQQRLLEEQKEKALKKATQRAPISAVNKALSETSEGKTKGVKGFGLRSLEQASERYKQRQAKKNKK